MTRGKFSKSLKNAKTSATRRSISIDDRIATLRRRARRRRRTSRRDERPRGDADQRQSGDARQRARPAFRRGSPSSAPPSAATASAVDELAPRRFDVTDWMRVSAVRGRGARLVPRRISSEMPAANARDVRAPRGMSRRPKPRRKWLPGIAELRRREGCSTPSRSTSCAANSSTSRVEEPRKCRRSRRAAAPT